MPSDRADKIEALLLVEFFGDDYPIIAKRMSGVQQEKVLGESRKFDQTNFDGS